MPRRFGSPLQAIIHFFMTAPLAEAQSGLEAAKAVVANRVAAPAAVPWRRRPAPAPPATPPNVTEQVAAAIHEANATPAASAARPRQRARRSDAGRPRGAAAPAGPVRRQRPAVAAAVPTTAIAHELPDSYVPPEADEA